jgi:hypothetical protein
MAILKALIRATAVSAIFSLVSSIPFVSRAPPGSRLGIEFDDDFYNAPAGFEKQPLGSIIRHRPVPKPLVLNGTVINLVDQAWQLLYRTQNSVGAPEAAIMTIIKPKNAKRDHLFSESYFTVSAEVWKSECLC